MPAMPVLTAEDRAKQTRWENRVGKSLKNWVSFVMKDQGLTRTEAREIVLKKIESKDGRVRKASIISISNGRFLTTSSFPATPESPELEISGLPHVKSDKESVRVGCVRFTNEALNEINRLRWEQLSSREPIVFQVGDYGDPE